MSFGGDLQDARALDRIAAELDREDAAPALEEILARRPREPRAAALLVRARSARGESEAALEAAEGARAGLRAGAWSLLRAEALLDAGQGGEARAVLEEGRAAEPDNIALAGLLRVLDLEDGLSRGAKPDLKSFLPGAIWSPPVLSRLVLALESELERRAAAGSAPPELHRARTAAFRPRLEKDAFRRFWFEGLGAFLSRLGGREARDGKARKLAVRNALRAGELERAAEALRGAASGEERLLALEIAFALARFAEAVRLHEDWMQAGGEPQDAYAAALAAYAFIALRKPRRARELLAPPLSAPGPRAELRHLAALIEIQEGKRPRAACLLGLAAGENDIALAQVAREEAAFLGS